MLKYGKEKYCTMKKIYLLLSVLCIASLSGVMAQQSAHYTQYMFNPYIINPAIAGTHLYYQIRSSHRFQWVGMTDAPITNAMACYGPHSSKDMGWGGYIFNDITGPTSRTGFMGTYAYNIAVTSDIRVSGGLSFGFMQYKYDKSKIDMYEANDPTDADEVEAQFTPDAKLGFYVYSSSFNFGISADQILHNDFKKKDLGVLIRHYYIMGGYKVFINRDFAVEPSIMMKKVIAAPFQAEISCRAIMQNQFWGGLSFRTRESLSVLLGYIHNDKIEIGYSYDIGVNDMRRLHTGSHEMMIGYKFDDIKKMH